MKTTFEDLLTLNNKTNNSSNKAQQADALKTNELMSLLKFQIGEQGSAKSHFLVSERDGLFVIEESGDPKTKRAVGNYQNIKSLNKNTKFFAFICENRVIVYEISALQDEQPKCYLEVTCVNLVGYHLSEEFLHIDDKTSAVLIDIVRKKLVFKGVQAIEDKCQLKCRPIACKTQMSFYHFPAANHIIKYSRLKTPASQNQLLKTSQDPELIMKENMLLIKQIPTLTHYIDSEYRQEEEICLPKSAKITSANLAFNDQLLLLIMSEKMILVLSNTLKPEQEFKLPLKDVHESQIKMSPDKKSALILFTNYFDESARSYYGENFLYLLSLSSGDLKSVPTIIGPVHSVVWTKNSEEFIVFSGHMPAHVLFYNKLCEPKIELGILFANFGKFSPNRRYLAIGASGNLSSSLLIYDNQELKLVSEVKGISGSRFAWLPDSNRFTLVVSQDKLKVENKLSVFNINGELLLNIDYSDGQLFEVAFCGTTKSNPNTTYYAQKDNTERVVKAKRIMNLKTTDTVDSVFKKESREIKFLINDYIDEVNVDLQKKQKEREEEAKAKKEAKAKLKPEVAPKVLLARGSGFQQMKAQKVEAEVVPEVTDQGVIAEAKVVKDNKKKEPKAVIPTPNQLTEERETGKTTTPPLTPKVSNDAQVKSPPVKPPKQKQSKTERQKKPKKQNGANVPSNDTHPTEDAAE